MTDSSDYLEKVRTRIAPSPTGDPHVGTYYVALFNYVFARKAGGDFVLRIEDTDRTRFVQGAEQRIIDGLKWLQMQHDEGPDVGGEYGPYRQSERYDLYREHARRLIEKGRAYRCFCTAERLEQLRARQREEKLPFGYDQFCRRLSPEELQEKLARGVPHVIRLSVPDDGHTGFTDRLRGPVTIPNAEVDDQILIKSDGYPTYHLANVVDDHLMRISHVIRAEEWISSTPKHVLLYEAFGWPMPEFIHLSLLRNTDKSKISKRKNPTSIDWYRDEGFLPEALRNFLALMGFSIGGDREVFEVAEMIEKFTWDRVRTSEPVFDLEKLDHMNGLYIRALSDEELARRIVEGGYTTHTDAEMSKMASIAALIRDRLERLRHFDEATRFFFEVEDYEPDLLIPKKKDGPFVRESLDIMIDVFEALENWEAEPLEARMHKLREDREWSKKTLRAVYMVLRVAVTCRVVSTPMFETMEVLGRAECLKRLRAAREKAADLQ